MTAIDEPPPAADEPASAADVPAPAASEPTLAASEPAPDADEPTLAAAPAYDEQAPDASEPGADEASAADESPAEGEAPRDRRARAARVLELLDRYVPAPAIPLEHGSPFQLLVAVILSAQCTDARVNMVTPALFARAPDAHAMAKLRSTQIQPFIRTCGLSANKARSISAVSRILVREHGGEVPRDLAALEALPGVGHKTASVVVTQAFGEPAFPVDTHIHRLAGRWQLSRARTVEEVEHDLKALFPRERWSTLHLQFIYFGRQYCTAKGHVPSDCPICSWAMSKARALREERQGLSKPLTRPKPKRTPRAKPAPKPTPAPKSKPAPAPKAATAPKATTAPKPASASKPASKPSPASKRRTRTKT